MTATELLPQIFKLSPPDQLLLVEAIRNHLAGTQGAPESPDEFNAELDRRHDDMLQNPADETPWDVVRARLGGTA